jgi:hypothetical protein
MRSDQKVYARPRAMSAAIVLPESMGVNRKMELARKV